MIGITDRLRLRNLRLDTPAGNFIYRQLYAIIAQQRSGLTFCGPPRVGLTEALKLAIDGLSTLMPDLPIYSITAAEDSDDRPGRAWARLLAQIAPCLEVNRDPLYLRRRTKHVIATKAHAIRQSQALLIVDRAHALSTRDFLLLPTLQDDLRSEGISLAICLAGYPSLIQTRIDLMVAGHLEPAQRYLLNPLRVFGIRHSTDLVDFLDGFDKAVFDEERNLTVCQFFRPKLWGTGWRLSAEAIRLWAALSPYAVDAKGDEIPSGIEIDYLFAAVCHQLERGDSENEISASMDAAAWKAAVDVSGLVEARLIEAELLLNRESSDAKKK